MERRGLGSKVGTVIENEGWQKESVDFVVTDFCVFSLCTKPNGPHAF